MIHYLLIDTDSMCIAMTGEMEEIVKPEYQHEWEEAKKIWFVQDENDPWQTRLPGLMKSEWNTSNGGIFWYVSIFHFSCSSACFM